MKKGIELEVGDTFKQYGEWFTIESFYGETDKTRTFTFLYEGIKNYGSFRKVTNFQIR